MFNFFAISLFSGSITNILPCHVELKSSLFNSFFLISVSSNSNLDVFEANFFAITLSSFEMDYLSLELIDYILRLIPFPIAHRYLLQSDYLMGYNSRLTSDLFLNEALFFLQIDYDSFF